jgi:circadian clock protein KaiB
MEPDAPAGAEVGHQTALGLRAARHDACGTPGNSRPAKRRIGRRARPTDWNSPPQAQHRPPRNRAAKRAISARHRGRGVKRRDKRGGVTPSAPERVIIRLYIAGGAPNSVRAMANLNSICGEYLKDHYELEIIDILQQPLRALVDGVMITPTLSKVSPQPATRLVGDLGAREEALGLADKAR